jgi:hypothetical protein
VTAGTSAYVWCDYLDMTAPPGRRVCPGRIEEGQTRAEARRAAKKLGWAVAVHVRSTKRGGDFDYCPDHKPADPETASVAAPTKED